MAKNTSRDRQQFEYLVIGAGPAGLQLGYYLSQAGRSYLILERGGDPGEFFKEFPRHRQLISINKVHTGYDDPEVNLRWDWNSLLGDPDAPLFKDYSRDYFPTADQMVDYLNEYARYHKLNIRYDTRVTRVEKDQLFEVFDEDGNCFTAPRLIVATGLSKPYRPPIEGYDLAENYVDVSIDPEEFSNQRVLIVGKGNSGFETADNLIAAASVIHVASPEPLRFAWKSHYVGHLRALNNNFLDTYQLKSQNAVLDCNVERIERRNGEYVVTVSYSHADGEVEELVYDRVICCTGFRLDTSIFSESCKPELAIKDRFPALTSAWESTNVPDLYFAGTLMQMRDFKKYTSGFIHGFRYNVRALHRVFEQRYHGNSWPTRALGDRAKDLADAVIARVNRTSALWQQFSFLCDLIVMSEDGAHYYEELPIDYVHDSGQVAGSESFIINLAFGESQPDPFQVQRHPNPERGDESFFLHPVVRHYRGSEMLGEHHILEDLYGEWKKEDVHIEPLREFLDERLAARAMVNA